MGLHNLLDNLEAKSRTVLRCRIPEIEDLIAGRRWYAWPVVFDIETLHRCKRPERNRNVSVTVFDAVTKQVLEELLEPSLIGSDRWQRLDLLEEFQDTLGLEHIVYIGNSLGGGLGLRLAAQHPEHIDGLVLLAAGGGTLLCQVIDSLTTPLFAQYFVSPLVVRLLINDAYGPHQSPDRETVRRYHDLVLRHRNRQTVRELAQSFRDAHPDDCGGRNPIPTPPSIHGTEPKICDAACAEHVQVPVLFQWGAKDQWLPLSFGRKLEALVDDSRFIVYEDLGHVPMEEAPKRTVRDVGTFLTETIR